MAETCQLCKHGEKCEAQKHALKIIKIFMRENEVIKIPDYPIHNILFTIAAGCKKFKPIK